MNSDKTLDLVLSEIDLVEVFQRFSYEELNIFFGGGTLEIKRDCINCTPIGCFYIWPCLNLPNSVPSFDTFCWKAPVGLAYYESPFAYQVLSFLTF